MSKITFPIRLESTNGSIFEIRETSSRNNPVQIWEKRPEWSGYRPRPANQFLWQALNALESLGCTIGDSIQVMP